MWHLYISGFFFSIIKFLFAATYLDRLSFGAMPVSEIFIVSASGGLFGFNVFYWFSGFFMERARKKRHEALLAGTAKKRKSFTRVNKFIVKMKMSRFGLYILSTIAMLFMSLPIGGVVLAKFYRDKKLSYILATITIILTAFLLANFNKFIFA